MKAETKAPFGNDVMSVDLRAFIDRVIVPALLDHFLREQAAAGSQAPTTPIRPAA